MPGLRLDSALVRRGLIESRTKAHRRIEAGDVLVNGVPTRKASWLVEDGDTLEVQGGVDPVGRGAFKLDAALDEWGIDPAGRHCVDLGASTGGFTEVLLARGAEKVVALDVGHDQLHPKLRADSRVISREGVNVRDLTPDMWGQIGVENVSLVVADLSFISLTNVIPAVVASLGLCEWVCLVKPQFEVGRKNISEGIAKDPGSHERAIHAVVEVATSAGLQCRGIMMSPITGEAGNREYLCWLGPTHSGNQTQWTLDIHSLTHS